MLKVGAGFGFETGGGFGCGGSGVAGRYPCFEGRGGGAVGHDGDKNKIVLCAVIVFVLFLLLDTCHS